VVVLLAVACVDVEEATESARPLESGRPPGVSFVSTPAGDVSVRDGTLVVERLDLRVHTRLGIVQIGQTWSGAPGAWHDWLDLTYDGETLVDAHGTVLQTDRLEGTSWVRVDDTTLRTRGGRVHRFEQAVLERIEAPSPGGAALSFERDATGRLTRIVQDMGDAGFNETVLEVRYEPRGVELESHGRVVRSSLDGRGRLIAVRGPSFEDEGARTTYAYDSRGRLRSVRGGSDGEVSVGYDALDRVFVVQRGWDRWRLVRVFERARPVDSRFGLLVWGGGRSVTEYRHDGSGRVTWRRDPDGAIWRAGYDGNLLAWADDPLGARWSFAYQDGDLVSRTDPLGARETFDPAPGGWNPARPDETPWSRRTDRRGGVWTQEFDEHGRPTVLVDRVGDRREYAYRGGQLRRIRSPSGLETCLYYDDSHGLVTRVDPGCRGRAQSILRTPPGWLLGPAAGGFPVYDGGGRLLEIDFPSGSATRPDRLVFERDRSGRVTATTGPAGGRVELERDAAGRVRAIRERVVQAGDDDWGQTGDVWTEERIERDPSGRVMARVRPDGTRLELERDVSGRLVGRRYVGVDGRTLAELRLDRDPAGRVVRIDDSAAPGPLEIERDPLGRARVVRYPHGEWAEQELDASGELVRLDLYAPDGAPIRSLEWIRDAEGRPIRLLDGGESVVDVSYTPALETVRHANGVIEELHRDPRGRLSWLVVRGPDGTTLREFELQYQIDDGVTSSVLTSLLDHSESGEGFFVGYDGAGRVGSWDGDRRYSFRWDVIGNLMDAFASEPSTPSSRTSIGYNAARTRMRWINGEEVEHDLRGRVTRIGDLSVEWESYDRPRRLGDVELRYGASGLALSRTEGGERTNFLFGGLVRADSDLNPTIVEVADLLVDLRTGEREHLHRDVRNNVSWVTDDRGSLVASRRMGPFEAYASMGSTRSRRGFAGGEEIGPFILLGRRVYYPRAARFVTPDPLPDWINPYSYVQGDPVHFWDPGGLRRVEVRRSARITLTARPLPAFEAEYREEILIDEPPGAAAVEGEPTETEERTSPDGAAPGPIGRPPLPLPPLVPPVPPVRPVGCDAIAASPIGVTVLGLLLPLLLLLARRSGPLGS
jgi:RHS repeat-associated protein